MGSLRHQRNHGLSFLMGAMALPSTMNRSDIVGFELRRYFQQIDYRLISPQTQLARSLQALGAALGDSTTGALAQHPTPTVTVTLTPSVLEAQLGGPQISTFLASTKEELVGTGPKGPTGGPHAGAGTYASLGFLGILPPEPFPVPAQQIAPILRYNEILEIEKMAQHVVRSTVRYSQAVWISLTAEERTIMLEGYTIGVPPNGIADATQMVPLLNSVENRVLGFFGNSMIMPFTLPSVLGNNDQPGLSTGEIEAALANFHQIGFNPPQSTVALPTRGVLGEAVLGHCASAEKIDLTRFWNWQDSPSDTAPAISPVTLPTTSGSISAPLTAPNSLTTLTPLINNILSAPSPDSALLQALAKTSIQPDFSTGSPVPLSSRRSLARPCRLRSRRGPTRSRRRRTCRHRRRRPPATSSAESTAGTLPPVPVRWPRKTERRRTRAARRRTLAQGQSPAARPALVRATEMREGEAAQKREPAAPEQEPAGQVAEDSSVAPLHQPQGRGCSVRASRNTGITEAQEKHLRGAEMADKTMGGTAAGGGADVSALGPQMVASLLAYSRAQRLRTPWRRKTFSSGASPCKETWCLHGFRRRGTSQRSAATSTCCKRFSSLTCCRRCWQQFLAWQGLRPLWAGSATTSRWPFCR